MPKEQAPEKLKDNPAEFTTCDQCDVRRRLPDPCKCKRKGVHGDA